jgi:SAM-dependent methyltransferase
MPDPILPGRLGLYLSMFIYGLRGYGDFAEEHAGFHRAFREFAGDLRGRRVLDLGCGKTFWLTLLLASDGADVIGVDTEVTDPRRSPGKYLRLMRTNGLERTLRTLTWDLLFAGPYYRRLEAEYGAALAFDRVRMLPTDGSRLPVPDKSLDWIVSHEVLEHVRDLTGVVRELKRALKPDGRTYLYVHHFTSLSGGHHIAWKHPDTSPSRKVPPWDHLRSRQFTDIPSWLNGVRAHEYRALIEAELEILEWRWLPREGEALLTPAIRAELGKYSEEELLHKGFIVIARPRPGGSIEASAG